MASAAFDYGRYIDIPARSAAAGSCMPAAAGQCSLPTLRECTGSFQGVASGLWQLPFTGRSRCCCTSETRLSGASSFCFAVGPHRTALTAQGHAIPVDPERESERRIAGDGACIARAGTWPWDSPSSLALIIREEFSPWVLKPRSSAQGRLNVQRIAGGAGQCQQERRRAQHLHAARLSIKVGH